MMDDETCVALGLDVGTSSVKAAITVKKTILDQVTIPYELSCDGNRGEQDPAMIIDVIQQCLEKLDIIALGKVEIIGICGQMHGCVLWMDEAWSFNSGNGQYKINQQNCSNLYTWEDRRCDEEFLASLPKSDSLLQLSSGFGCATIFWLMKNDPNYVKLFKNGGTIMDFVVAMVCNLSKPCISDQNAANWGYYDPLRFDWNINKLKSSGFPIDLLPTIRRSGEIAGHLKSNWINLKKDIPVMVAVGDVQSSVYMCMENEPRNCAVLNVSTSIQLSYLMPYGFDPNIIINNSNTPGQDESTRNSIVYFPYFGGRYLAVAACLSGGNVLQCFVLKIKEMIGQIGGQAIQESCIWEYLHDNDHGYSKERTPTIKPTLFGERHQPNATMLIDNIRPDTNIADIYHGLCRGLIKNTFTMMPLEELIKANVTCILGTGKALLNNPVLKNCLDSHLSDYIEVKPGLTSMDVLPFVRYINNSDAHVGVAMVALAKHA